MFNHTLRLDHTIADGVTKTFVRNRQIDGESHYVDLASLSSNNILQNSLAIRATVKGSALKPLTFTRTHNLNRTLVMLDGAGNAQKAMVNFTITVPGGTTISETALKSMTEDIFILITNLDDANLTGGSVESAFEQTYFTAVLASQV